jgi:hypothetical protein
MPLLPATSICTGGGRLHSHSVQFELVVWRLKHQRALLLGGGGVTRRHIRHTLMALRTGIVAAVTLRWGNPTPHYCWMRGKMPCDWTGAQYLCAVRACGVDR